jgi:hypothetical protein
MTSSNGTVNRPQLLNFNEQGIEVAYDFDALLLFLPMQFNMSLEAKRTISNLAIDLTFNKFDEHFSA